MRSQIQILFLLIIFIIPNENFAQRAKRKSVKTKMTHYPALAVGDISTYRIRIYPGNNPVDQDDLREKKGIGTKLQNFQDKVNKVGGPEYYTFNAIQPDDVDPDVLIEIGFGNFEVTGKSEVEWKIPCTYKGAELKKENIMECPAYYYELSYSLPVILKISDASGSILHAVRFDNTKTTAFGKSELAGFLKKEELAAAYAKDGVQKSLGVDAMIERLEELNIPLNSSFYFYDEEIKLDVATGSGSYDYPELDKAFGIAESAYESYPINEDNLLEAVSIWESSLDELDKDDKKARIAPNLGMGLYENLATAYQIMSENEKAKENIEAALEMQQLIANKTREPMLLQQRTDILRNMSVTGNTKANKALMNGSQESVGSILADARVKEKDASYQFLAGGYVYDDFNSEYKEFYGASDDLQSEDPLGGATTLGELLGGGSKSYKDRIMVMGVNKQLILNDVWGDKLDAFPGEVCELTELNQLNITDQPELSTLPPCIGNLKELKKLNLWNNSLSSLPSEIGQLTNLEVLDVSNNKLTELPVELKNCKNLKKLVVKGNSISNLNEISSAFSKLKVK